VNKFSQKTSSQRRKNDFFNKQYADAKNDGVHIVGHGSIMFTERFSRESEKKLRRTRKMEEEGEKHFSNSRNLIRPRREKSGRARLNGSMRKRGVFEVR